MKYLSRLSVTVLAATSGLMFGIIQAASASSLTWKWNYSGTGVDAKGTLTTNDTPDSSGFYQITSIKGKRNGVKITGLQLTGTPIPGNEPYIVDNLINPNSSQLTGDGFGYSTADGNYVNPFFASFLAPSVYLEYFSASPFVAGTTGPEDSELTISFSATIKNGDLKTISVSTVPEPLTILGVGTAIAFGAGFKRKLAQKEES